MLVVSRFELEEGKVEDDDASCDDDIDDERPAEDEIGAELDEPELLIDRLPGHCV